MSIIYPTIQIRRGYAADFTGNNGTLSAGEWALEIDTNKVKVGDGSTAWTSLPYFPTWTGALTATSLSAGSITATDITGATELLTTGLTAVAISAGSIDVDFLQAALLAEGLTAIDDVKLSGDGLTYDDVRMASLSMRLGASAPDLIALSGNVYCHAFDGGGSTEQAFFAIQLPHSYKLGSNIEPHVHWTEAVAAVGDVVWGFEYTVAMCGDIFPDTVTLTGLGSTDGSAPVHRVTELPTIVGSGFTQPTVMLMCRVFRPSGQDEDTYASDAFLLEFDMHFQVDGFGTDAEWTKSW